MILVFNQNSLLFKKSNNGYQFPELTDLQALELKVITIPHTKYQLVAYSQTNNLADPNLAWIGLRQVFPLFSPEDLQKIVYTHQMGIYYLTNVFCSFCGRKLTLNPVNQKYMVCKQCNQEIYPKISPAIMVRITKQNQILLAQGVNFAPNIWSVIAGYSDINENLEDTVKREVLEEVGIQIENIQYWGSQYWPLSSSLIIAFSAEYASGEIKIDPQEIKQAGFFCRDNIPGMPSTTYLISYALIKEFIDHE